MCLEHNLRRRITADSAATYATFLDRVQQHSNTIEAQLIQERCIHHIRETNGRVLNFQDMYS